MKTSQEKSKGFLVKGLVLLMAITLLAQPFMLFGSASEGESYSTEIMAVKGGKDAIATFTVDDGMYANDAVITELFGTYGLPVSLMVVPSRIQGIPPYSVGYSTVLQINDFLKSDLVDIGSHSYSHIYMQDGTEAATEENYIREVIGAKEYLEANLPVGKVITFATPGGSNYSADAMKVVQSTYYAARSAGGATASSIQALTPSDDLSQGSWQKLKAIWLSESQVSNIKAYLDACVENGGWFISGVHNVIGTTIGTGNYDMTKESLEDIVKYAKAYADENKLWVASFTDATKYLREYQHSTVSQYTNDYGMYVNVTMDEKTENGLALSADIFDMPLTVKVEIPEGWENVRLSQRGESTTVKSFREGDTSYVYAEIVPNSGAVLVSNADTPLTLHTSNATLTMAKGGATGIATMTFDDGNSISDAKLKELCEKYDLPASVMLNTNNFSESTLLFWQNYFADGNVSLDAHSMTHANMSQESLATPELIQREVVDQYNYFREYFPDQDTLAFGYPYSSYAPAAKSKVMEYYYAARGSVCTVISAPGKMQSLDPTFDNAAGSWYNLYQVRMQQNNSAYQPGNSGGNPVITHESVVNYLNKCATAGGWFLSISHRIVPEASGHYDVTVDQLSEIMELMNELKGENKLWVASFTDATKYIRERQNSTVSVKTYGDGVYLIDVVMADKTADGLPLDLVLTGSDGKERKVFSMPLTVKVELPGGWKQVVYSQAGGEEMVADTFTELDKTYAYVDVVPNGGEVKLTYASASGSDMTVSKPVGYYEAPEGSYAPTNADVTYATFKSESDFLNNSAPIAEYTEGAITAASVSGAGIGYVHIYKNIASSEKFETVAKQPLVINLGGKTIASFGGFRIKNASDSLVIKNGGVNIAGQMHGYGGGKMAFENAYINCNYATMGHGFTVYEWLFRDCTLQLNKNDTYFYLGSNPLTGNCEIIFDNTDIAVTGSVSATKGLFSVSAHNGSQYSFNVILKKNSSLRGNVPLWLSVNEADGIKPFESTQSIFIEEGFSLTEEAKPDFKYSLKELDSASAVLTDADGGKGQITVVEPGTKYALLGDIVYKEAGAGYYTVTVPGGEIDMPVGTYLKPEGSWTPTDSTITYAVWNNEQEYLDNKAPKYTSTSTTLDHSHVLAGGYLHLFGKVKCGTLEFKSSAALTVNLGGNQLTSFAIKCGENKVDLVIKNGKLNASGQINMRANSTLLIENVDLYDNYDTALHGAALKSVIYRNSIVTLASDNVYFWLGSNPLLSSIGEIRFENTHLNVTGAVTKENHALFKINVHSRPENAFHITFDKKSTISGNVPCLVGCFDSASKAISSTQVVRFELGFTVIGADALPSFKYLSQELVNGTLAATPTLKDASDTRCQIIVVKPGETTPLTEGYSFVENDGIYVLKLTASDKPDTPDEPDVWKPAADTIFAVFESYEAYTSGLAPIKEYNEAITTSILTSRNELYVVLYKDASTSGRLDLVSSSASHVTLDLNGKALNLTAGFLTRYGYFKITNGTLNFSGGQIHPREKSTVIYEGLTINATSGNLGYGTCTKLLEYNDCTVYLNSSANYFYLAGDTASDRTVINIVKTHFVLNKSLNAPFFDIMEQIGDYNARFDINIDGESSITGSGTMPGLVRLKESFDSAKGTKSEFSETQIINIADGFKVSTIIDYTYYEFLKIDLEASIAAGKEVYESTALLGNDDRCKIYLGGVLAKDAVLYANPDSAGAAYSLSYSQDTENVGWYLVNSDGIYVGARAVKNGAGVAIFTGADLNKIPKGATVYFAQDIITSNQIDPNSKDRTDITFDLGGNTFTIDTNRFTVAYHDGTAWHPLSFTFKNGTIASSADQPMYGYGHADAVFTFDGVTVDYTGGGRFIDVYTGTFVFKNSTVNALSGYATFFQKDGNSYRSVKIENSTLNVAYAIGTYGNSNLAADFDELYIKNSTLNCTAAVLFVDNAGNNPDAYLNLDIASSSIKAPYLIYLNEAPVCKVNVRLSDTYLSSLPAIEYNGVLDTDGLFTVSYAEGEKLMKVCGKESYSYYVGSIKANDGDFTANLTLYTSFNLNFFANPESISGVYYNGELLSAIDYEGRVKYTLYGIAPNTAADSLELTVGVIKDSVTYKVPISYSVLAYAKQVVEGEYSTLAKQLALSAVKYIQSAYVYCGKAAPEFDAGGVVITASDTTGESVESLTAAVDSVQLNLKESPYIRFNLKAGYTGTVKINDASFEIENGSFGEFTYVEIAVRAKDLTRDFTVEADGKCVSYNLKNYRNSEAVKADESLKALIDALYTYGEYAKEYSVNNPDLD